MIPSCCIHKSTDKQCKRPKDNKIFKLPRKFTRLHCLTENKNAISSCAPYKYCKKPKFGKFNVYINQNPNDTIPIKYTTLNNVKQTITKLEKLYKNKSYPHKRIWQVGMILYVRLKPLKEKKLKHFELAKKYHKFLSQRTKLKGNNRFNLVFQF